MTHNSSLKFVTVRQQASVQNQSTSASFYNLHSTYTHLDFLLELALVNKQLLLLLVPSDYLPLVALQLRFHLQAQENTVGDFACPHSKTKNNVLRTNPLNKRYAR